MTRRQKIFSAIGRFFKNLFTKNIALKISALLFALLLWGYVLTMENPEYVKRVRSVEVTIVGEDALNNRGMMLITRDISTVDVDILCKINKHSELDTTRVTCSIDLSSIAANELDADQDAKVVQVPVTARLIDSEYGTIQSFSPNTVGVTIARTTSRRMTVSVHKTGTEADGYDYVIPDEVSLTLNGQKSVIDRIASASVTVDLGVITGEQSLILPVEFYDVSGTEPLDDVVDSNGATVTVEVPVKVVAYKDTPIKVNIVTSETFDERFEYEYEELQPTVRLIGSRDVLDTIETVETETYYPKMIEGTKDVSFALIIPEGTTLDASSTGTVTIPVTVTEKSVEEAIVIPLVYSGLKDDLAFAETPPETVTVTVSGKAGAVADFDPSWVTAIVELQNYVEGAHKVPISVSFMDQAQGCRFAWAMNYVDVTLVSSNPEVIETKAYAIPITYAGLGENVALADDAPKTISVLVTGSADDMLTFDPAWITVTVDLNGCGAGTHEREMVPSYVDKALLYQYEWESRTVSVVLTGKTEG